MTIRDVIRNEWTQRLRRQRVKKNRLHLESLEAKDLLAADIVSLSPASGTASVGLGDNLEISFSEDVQPGPGTGSIAIRNADDGTLIEGFSLDSDRVTLSGSTLTIDPTEDLPPNANINVFVDGSLVKDSGSDTTTATLLGEDFEGLALVDSPLASDDLVFDVNNYVLVMSGVLNVLEAGEYTFGINSDDGQQLAIDFEQDGLDLIDDEVIFDDSTHGNQDRLSTCGSTSPDQSCVGSGEGAVTLDVGEYAFEFWYFEAGGGSSGEFFYAPGEHEEFSAADFVLVGDDSKGIGVTADGITATTYKSTGDVGSMTAAEEVVDGINLEEGFPQSAPVDLADVWNTGGTGRFDADNPLPGFPAPEKGDNRDWTGEAPFGWTLIERTCPGFRDRMASPIPKTTKLPWRSTTAGTFLISPGGLASKGIKAVRTSS